MKRLVLMLGILSCCSTGLASNIFETRITGVLAGPFYGDLVFLQLSTRPDVLPNCATNPQYTYVFDASSTSGQHTLALVRLAFEKRQPVWLAGLDTCALFPDTEDLRHIKLLGN